MEIVVLSIVAGLVVVVGIWMATRETKPVESGISANERQWRDDTNQ